jgi:hypothetical protein
VAEAAQLGVVYGRTQQVITSEFAGESHNNMTCRVRMSRITIIAPILKAKTPALCAASCTSSFASMQGGTLSNRTLRLHDTKRLVRVCCPSAACGATSAVPRVFVDVDVGVGDAYMCLVVHHVAGRLVCDTIARQTRCKNYSFVSCISITGRPIRPSENHVFPRSMFAAQPRFQPRI